MRKFDFDGCTMYHDDIDEYEFKFVYGWCKAFMDLKDAGWKFRNIYIVDKKMGRCMQAFFYKIEDGQLADELSLTYYLPNYRKKAFYED